MLRVIVCLLDLWYFSMMASLLLSCYFILFYVKRLDGIIILAGCPKDVVQDPTLLPLHRLRWSYRVT
jgi:hypothetical protein